MAIYKRNNVVEMVRGSNCPYWKIFEDASKKTAGNYVASADFDVADLGINASCDALQVKLAMLSQGRYILTAYEKNDGKRKGLDSAIELEPAFDSPIAGIGAVAADTKIYIEGIGNVTPENIGEAMERKFQIMLDKQKEDNRVTALQNRVKELETEARENSSALNRGVMSIGTVLYTAVSKTPAFKEVMGVVGDITKMAKTEPAPVIGTTEVTDTTNNHVDGDMMEIGGTHVNQDRMLAALDKLGANNPHVLDHIESLAALKQNDPDSYQAGLDFINATS
jgi:hypothetical protein